MPSDKVFVMEVKEINQAKPVIIADIFRLYVCYKLKLARLD